MNDLVQKKVAESLELPAIKEGLVYIQNGLEEQWPSLAERWELVLPYHNIAHAKDTLHEALLFALPDNKLTKKELELLAVAAVYHDAGFINGGQESNGERSVQIIAERLPRYKYTEDKIKRIRATILAGPNKKLRTQEALGGYLVDADVSNFGRDDFFKKSEDVFQEYLAMGELPEDTPQTRKEFYINLYTWMPKYEWQTKTARELRSEKHKENAQKLKKLIDEINKK